jgi:hypothetical protein
LNQKKRKGWRFIKTEFTLKWIKRTNKEKKTFIPREIEELKRLTLELARKANS